MGRPDFGRPASCPAPSVAHALHDDDFDVVDEEVVEAVDDGLPAELDPALSLGCRWRVPLTRVHNLSGVFLLYRDQLDVQILDQVMVYVKVYGFLCNFIHIHINVNDVQCKCVGLMAAIRRRVG